MNKETKLTVYVCAFALLLLLAAYPLAAVWKPQPAAPAFAKLEPGNGPFAHAPDPLGMGAPYTGASTAEQQPETLDGGSPGSPGAITAPLSVSVSNHTAAAASDTPAALPADSPAASPSVSPAAAAGPQPTSQGTDPEGGVVSLKTSVHDAVYQPVSIPVLNYHSVSVHPGNIVTIRPERFEEQMRYLKDKGYHPLRMEDFISILERKQAAPANPVLLTFDDGYTDNFVAAMPVLKKFGFPATLFMSPGMTETPGYLNWDQVKELQKAGWDIYPHGMTHSSLPKLTPEQQAFEITEARKQIEEHLNVRADVFCYPYGEYNKETLRILSKNGFRYAFTIDQGKAASGQHPFKLKRLFVNGEEKLSAFAAKLTK